MSRLGVFFFLNSCFYLQFLHRTFKSTKNITTQYRHDLTVILTLSFSLNYDRPVVSSHFKVIDSLNVCSLLSKVLRFLVINSQTI